MGGRRAKDDVVLEGGRRVTPQGTGRIDRLGLREKRWLNRARDVRKFQSIEDYRFLSLRSNFQDEL